MSAREDARTAVAKFDSMGPNLHTQAIADAASDAWEPIVRDLVGVVDDMLRTGGYLTEHREIVTRAKEALG